MGRVAAGLLTVLAVYGSGEGWARQIERVSVSDAEAEAWEDSWYPAISATGRYVTFVSSANNLVAGDTNTKSDIFVRDRLLGTTERVSIATDGTQADGVSTHPVISSDGRWVAFLSIAGTLVASDTNGEYDVFLRDRELGTMVCVSLDMGGAPAGSVLPNHLAMSRDGRYIAYASSATDIDPNDPNWPADVYRYDRTTGQTDLVSVGTNGHTDSSQPSSWPAMDPEGRYVAFCSYSNGLVFGDWNGGLQDIFLRDMQTQTTELISIGIDGEPTDKSCGEPFVSVDAEYVGFTSIDTTLVDGDWDGAKDVYWKVRFTGLVQELTWPSNGDCNTPSLSDSSLLLLFSSSSYNLASGDNNGQTDVFLRDLSTGVYELVSMLDDGTQGDGISEQPAMTPDASHVVFASAATNLVTGDTRRWDDIFLAFSAPLAVHWPR